MTGKEMLSKLILSLNSYQFNTNETVEEIVIIDEDLKAALTTLKELNPPTNFSVLINSLDKLIDEDIGDFLNNDYNVLGNVEIIDLSQPNFVGKNRAFAFSDLDFGFFSSKLLFQNGSIIDISEQNNEILWKQIQEFLERCYELNDNLKIIDFLNCIKDGNVDRGFVINKNLVTFDPYRHYSYIYFCYLNNSKSIDLSVDLKYSVSVINNSISLDSTKIYEQFFDVYDVLNELNQAPDILSRFLKLYHILEYLVYRVYLVELVNKVRSNKSFVREFSNSAEKMKAKEKVSFVKNFKAIFQSNNAKFITDLRPLSSENVINFLSDKGIVKDFVPSQIDKVALLIYGIRCSIVHNKESGYHLSITNFEDYSIIIPLIKKLIETLEFLVMQKISENDLNIKYPQKEITLY